MVSATIAEYLKKPAHYTRQAVDKQLESYVVINFDNLQTEEAWDKAYEEISRLNPSASSYIAGRLEHLRFLAGWIQISPHLRKKMEKTGRIPYEDFSF